MKYTNIHELRMFTKHKQVIGPGAMTLRPRGRERASGANATMRRATVIEAITDRDRARVQSTGAATMR